MFADLHLHTCFSDGTYTPEELAAHARQHNLAAVALTDHDTVEGCARMARACLSEGLEFITGAELTAEIDGAELHLLGYLIDQQNPELLAAMAHFQSVRQDRIRKMVARLNELDIPLAADAVFALANCQSPGRPHVGRALVQAGFCENMDEAFERFLKKHRPAWVPKFKISAARAIELIHQAGGVAVLAHPGLNRCDHLIPGLVADKLDGLECYHSKHTAAACEYYVEMAQRHSLVVTGGSDCHGLNKGKPLIGTIKLPYQHVRDLKNVAAAIRKRTPRPAASLCSQDSRKSETSPSL
jgi:3',5'-nucleoside bisphosphate phosphatase